MARPKPPDRDVTCDQCGIEYQLPEWRFRRINKNKFCSADCKHNWQRDNPHVFDNAHEALRGSTPWNKGERFPVECELCGKILYLQPCFVKTQRFCSQQCVGAWMQSHNPRVSSIEERVAEELLRRGIAFDRQVLIGRFIPDFVVGRTVVEVDGTYWHSLPKMIERDARKNIFYAEQGLDLIRIPEAEVRAGDFSRLDALAA